MKKKQVGLWALLCLSLLGCEDDVSNSNVPGVKFGLTINLNQIYKDANTGKNISLDQPAAVLTLSQNDSRFPTTRLGYRGLFVVHQLYDVDSYICFDRACPVDLYTIPPPNLLGEVTCPKCKTVYDIYTGGSVKQGEADEPLRVYRTACNGNRLIIAN